MNRPEKTTPTLVYLHGINSKGPEAPSTSRWKEGLARGLDAAGYPGIEEINVVAPGYVDLLKRMSGDPVASEAKLPPVTKRFRTPQQLKQQKAAFDRRTAAIERLLEDTFRGNENLVTHAAQAVAAVSIDVPWFSEASNYMSDESVRRKVLDRILRQLPQRGSVVLVGHSLGSVIAADLLPRIPQELSIAGMITIGSPLSQSNFDLRKLGTDLSDSPANLAWWVNFWSRTDPVTARRGAASAVPWLLDICVPTPRIPFSAHGSHEYLEEEIVGKAIGYALFGSQSRELAVIENGLDVPLDGEEFKAFVTLRFAHLVRDQLKGGSRERYGGALADTQYRVISDLVAKRTLEGRPIPGTIADLLPAADCDPETIKSPHIYSSPSRDDAAVLLAVLLLQNALHPYEIEVKNSVVLQAMQELAKELSLTSQFGTDAVAAVEKATTVLAGKKTLFMRWGLVGVGTLAVVASGGLLLAAAPGAAGAAAITSALASFGPGGMIGGLLSAGSLVSAGSGSIAVGVTSFASSAIEVESLVHGQLSLMILRQTWRLDNDDRIWNVWVDSERDLMQQRQRLARFNDSDSGVLKEIDRKLATVRKAISYAEDNELSPGNGR